MNVGSDWVQIAIALFSGGLITGVLAWLINNRKDKRTGFKEIIELLEKDNGRLREEFAQLRNEFESYKEVSYKREAENTKLIHNLQIKINLVESAHLDLPVPQWLKDTSGTMLSINPAYERVFGVLASDYIGKKDADVWDKDIADAFLTNDREVMITKEAVQRREFIKNDYHEGYWEILKFPRYEGRTLIGIGGIAFKMVNPQDLTDDERNK